MHACRCWSPAALHVSFTHHIDSQDDGAHRHQRKHQLRAGETQSRGATPCLSSTAANVPTNVSRTRLGMPLGTLQSCRSPTAQPAWPGRAAGTSNTAAAPAHAAWQHLWECAAWLLPLLTENVLEAVCAPTDSAMASPSVKIMGPHCSATKQAVQPSSHAFETRGALTKASSACTGPEAGGVQQHSPQCSRTSCALQRMHTEHPGQ